MKHAYILTAFLFYFTFTNAAVPLNDTCVNAQILAVTGTDQTVNFTIADAVQNFEFGCGTTRGTYSDVWFRFNMPVNGNIIINGGTVMNKFAIIKNSCTGEVVSCFNGSQIIENLTAGTIYRVRLFRTAIGSSNTSNLSFTIKYDVPVVHIPDANFKNYLLNNTAINTNGNSEIEVSEAAIFNGSINVRFMNIQNLTGIEAFSSLTELICENNNLSSLDISNNTLLTLLNCNSNNISSLDVTNNAVLRELQIAGNPIQSLDLSQCPILRKLYAVQCELYTLNIQNNTYLEDLNLQQNNLNTMDFSGSSSLRSLNVSYNNIVDLDVSMCPALSGLDCSRNSLSFLNIKNGNNTNFYLYATQNQYLQCIQVDDAQYSITNWSNYSQNLDGTAGYSEDCSSNCFVKIPSNRTVEQILIQDPNINTNQDGIITCQEANQYTGAIALSAMNLNDNDVAFIRNFANISYLDIGYNNIINIDLSQNTKLEYLNCSINQIRDLDLSAHINLKQLYCYSNNLRNLNVKNGHNQEFTGFQAFYNQDLNCIEVDNPTYSTSNWTNIDAHSSFSDDCGDYVLFSTKIYLEGSYIPSGNIHLKDALRVANLIPNTSPYQDAITCNASVFNVTGANAIVDWMWLELRSNTHYNTVVTGRSAFIQADGDIVDLDGKSSIEFNAPPGIYHVRIDHRNHLAVSTIAMNLSTVFYAYNFTRNVSLLLGNANAFSYDPTLGIYNYHMISGDYDANGQIQNSDKIGSESERGLTGYHDSDFNMNGQVQNDDITGKLLPNIGRGEQTGN